MVNNMINIKGLVVLLITILFQMLWPFAAGESLALASHQDRRMIPPGWMVFRGQSGLVAFHPNGWQIQERRDGAFLAYRPGTGGGATALALVEPIEKIEGRATGVVQGLGQIFPDLFPNVSISKSRLVSQNPEVAVAEIQYAPSGQPFRGLVMCFKKENRGVLYAIAASKLTWPQDEPVMKQILRSFFYSGGTVSMAISSGTTPLPQMVPWSDPREGAFSCPVPQGWKVEGGLIRFTAIDYREDILVTSPDNQILVRKGDSWIPSFVPPDQLMRLPEGNWYTPDGLNRLFVMRYLPGASFLTHLYLPQRVGPVSNVQTQNYPEIAQRIMAMEAQFGVPRQIDLGDVSFETQTEMGFRKGYAFAKTSSVRLHWRVELFFGYLAAPHLEQVAAGVLSKMLTGYQVNPQWFAQQLGLTGKVSEIMSKSYAEIGNMIHESYMNRSRSIDRTQERWRRAFIGAVIIEDPNTRERFEVPSGSNYYWRVGSGNEFVGTETDSPQWPGYWLQEMKVTD